MAAWIAFGSFANAQNLNNNNSFELISNGTFDNSLTGWVKNAPRSVPFAIQRQSDGNPTAGMANRKSLQHTLKQDILMPLSQAAGAGVRTFATRFRIAPDAPCSVRCVLDLTDSTGSSHTVLAERVIRSGGAWADVRGTIPVNWNGTLAAAWVSFEVGQKWETEFPDFTLDDVSIESDTDADGLADSEETITNPLLADTDGDALPDLWETQNQLDPAGANDANMDSDLDGFTNFQEFWAATDPQDAQSYPGRAANPNLNEKGRAILTYLALLPSIGKTVVGQHISYPDEFEPFVNGLSASTGYSPGLVEFQYDDNANPFQIATVNPLALDWAEKGGLLAIKFNPPNPWTGGAQAARTQEEHGLVDISALLDPASSSPENYPANLAANSIFMGWLDEVANGLDELQSKDVVVLYRTCAEMNGSWFWWGKRPQGHYQMLWRFMFNYFTQTKRLNNLIWVWEGDASIHPVLSSDYFFPGTDVVDVMGHNFYSDTWEQPFAIEQLYREYGKVYAFPQAGPRDQRDGTFDNALYADAITERFPRSSWFGVWNSFTSGTKIYQHVAIVDNENVIGLMQHARSLSRDEIDWTETEASAPTPPAVEPPPPVVEIPPAVDPTAPVEEPAPPVVSVPPVTDPATPPEPSPVAEPPAPSELAPTVEPPATVPVPVAEVPPTTPPRPGVAPSITLHPQSQAVRAGSDVIFQVNASGTPPLRFQWRKNGVDSPGANTASLLLANAQPADAGDYSAFVLNAIGSAQSVTATLQVLTPPRLSLQPDSQTVRAGNDVMLSVSAAEAEPLSYLWRFEDNALADSAQIHGSATPELRLRNVGGEHAGEYSVSVSGPGGTTESLAARIEVRAALHPQTLVRIENGKVKIRVFDASGGFITADDFQWLEVSASPDLKTWTKLAAALIWENGQPEIAAGTIHNQGFRFFRVHEKP